MWVNKVATFPPLNSLLYDPKELEKDLNKLGKEGWEVVKCFKDKKSTTVILKKEEQDTWL